MTVVLEIGEIPDASAAVEPKKTDAARSPDSKNPRHSVKYLQGLYEIAVLGSKQRAVRELESFSDGC